MLTFTKSVHKSFPKSCLLILQSANQTALLGGHTQTKRAAPGAGSTKRRPNQSAYEEATMAAIDVTKKLLIYHTLYRLNLSFSNIVTHCRTLQDAGVFTAKSTRLFQGYAQELQAEMNQEMLRNDALH